MALIGESAFKRDGGNGVIRRSENLGRLPDPNPPQILSKRLTEVMPANARQVARMDVDFGSDLGQAQGFSVAVVNEVANRRQPRRRGRVPSRRGRIASEVFEEVKDEALDDAGREIVAMSELRDEPVDGTDEVSSTHLTQPVGKRPCFDELPKPPVVQFDEKAACASLAERVGMGFSGRLVEKRPRTVRPILARHSLRIVTVEDDVDARARMIVKANLATLRMHRFVQ